MKLKIQANNFSSFSTSHVILPKRNQSKPPGYWINKQNILNFLEEIKQIHKLNTPEDWNSISQKQIQLYGGSRLLAKYSMYELKCMACPEGESIFNKPKQPKPSGYWENQQNILNFLQDLKKKYNLQTPEDWNLISHKEIKLNGGRTLLVKYSMYALKCIICPEGKSLFTKPLGYWDKEQNILNFLQDLKQKYNLQTPDDWNSLSQNQIKSNGGSSLLIKYSMYDLKCMACPDGKSLFDNSNPYKPFGYWDDRQNILHFLDKIKQKYNLKTPDNWNSISHNQIKSNGGSSLLIKYSMYDLKCMACPDGKLMFNKPNQPKPSGYWENQQNILNFLQDLKQKYNLQTIDDWNLLSQNQIKLNGGSSLLIKYSMYDLKCMACPDGKLIFKGTNQPKPSEYWSEEKNRDIFFDTLKIKFNLKTPKDWKRLSINQINSQGGNWLFYPNNHHYLEKTQIAFEIKDKNNKLKPVTYNLKQLILNQSNKRSSQRWLFLQIQKLFPGEEIVEDYFHSEISRESGFSVQFDIFLIKRKIAIEYHGLQHYEDIPSGFSPLELNKCRDAEKQTLCHKYGIQLIIIPYWWDNQLNSLKETLDSLLNKTI